MTFTDPTLSSVKKKPGSNAVRFVFCLLIAALFWLFNALSGLHENVIYVHLNYSIAKDKINTTKLPETAGIQVVSSGWQLLKELFFKRSLSIDLVNYSEHNILLTNDNSNLFSGELPGDFKIIHISPDTLNLEFDELIRKKIPVTLSFSSFKRNDYIIDSIKINPDSIIITGAKSSVENIIDWDSEIIDLIGTDSIYSGVSALKSSQRRNIDMSAIAIFYILRLSPAVHSQFLTELSTPGINNGISTVSVIYDVSEKYADNISEKDFEFIATYIETTRCFNISCSKFPSNVQNITIDPAFIYLTSQQ